MTPVGPGRSVEDERHQQNLRKFDEVDSDLKHNTDLTQQALRECQSNRHAVKGMAESVSSLLHAIERDRKDQKDVNHEFSVKIERLTNRFMWISGALAVISILAHELGDILSPLLRHLLGGN
jgi:myosin heavy subunit